ncbi:hypothetical protein CEXT_305021 [Caerostris extrusa]|uniref:Uncharacterized protein n=1 Tax=Caerostris extrusa TaxID=172846 RepID=A0AAV4Y704_CAEEX|nr:hypothetical protein CEXT_305021 [Caerostris extrusa]
MKEVNKPPHLASLKRTKELRKKYKKDSICLTWNVQNKIAVKDSLEHSVCYFYLNQVFEEEEEERERFRVVTLTEMVSKETQKKKRRIKKKIFRIPWR